MRRLIPIGQRPELVIYQTLSAGASLNFAAGCTRKGTRSYEHDGTDRHLKLFRDCLTDRRENGVGIQWLSVATCLSDHDQTLTGGGWHPEGDRSVGRKGVVTGSHRSFDVLRIQISAAEDDQVLNASGDIELTATDKSQVTAPQVRAVWITVNGGMKRLAGFFGFVPVALCDAGTGQPDFAFL